MSPRRGLLIAFEGCDRSGKTTQCARIVKDLNASSKTSAVGVRFPDRGTAIGGMLDAYLRGSSEVDDRAVHLLFSANRWEKVKEMREAIEKVRICHNTRNVHLPFGIT